MAAEISADTFVRVCGVGCVVCHDACEEIVEPRGPFSPHTEAVRPAFQHVRLHQHSCLTDGLHVLVELAVEGILSAVGVECGRDIACAELVHVVVRDAQPFIERVDHAYGADVCGDLVERVGPVLRIQSRAVCQSVEMQGFVTAEDTSGGESYRSSASRSATGAPSFPLRNMKAPPGQTITAPFTAVPSGTGYHIYWDGSPGRPGSYRCSRYIPLS